MKIERCIKYFCRDINREVEVKILVRLAERWCGYNIIDLSQCAGQRECGVVACNMMRAEEVKAADQLITDYHKQMDIRELIREGQKFSNQ